MRHDPLALGRGGPVFELRDTKIARDAASSARLEWEPVVSIGGQDFSGSRINALSSTQAAIAAWDNERLTFVYLNPLDKRVLQTGKLEWDQLFTSAELLECEIPEAGEFDAIPVLDTDGALYFLVSVGFEGEATPGYWGVLRLDSSATRIESFSRRSNGSGDRNNVFVPRLSHTSK